MCPCIARWSETNSIEVYCRVGHTTNRSSSWTNGDHLGDPYDLADHLWRDPSTSPRTSSGGHPPSATDDQLDQVYGEDHRLHLPGSPPLTQNLKWPNQTKNRLIRRFFLSENLSDKFV